MAGASMLAVIPLAGGILKGSAKTAIKFTDEAALAVKISKYTDDLTKAGAKLLRKLDEVFNAGRVGRYSLEIDPITGLTYRAKHFRDHVINQPDLRRIYGNIPDEIALERLTQSFVSTKTSTKRFWQSMPGGKDQTRIGRTMVYDTTTKEFATFTPKIDGSVQIHTHFVPDNPDDYVFNVVEGQIKVFNYIEIK